MVHETNGLEMKIKNKIKKLLKKIDLTNPQIIALLLELRDEEPKY